jgi:RimJ/RimL family protein N-acetyltransferase
MMKDILSGRMVRFLVVEPDTDTPTLIGWNRDSEFLRLADSNPAIFFNEKFEKKWLEKEVREGYSFKICTLMDDRLIGSLELSDVNPVTGNAWVGIAIGERGDWGKGYGTDALEVMLRFAFSELNLHRISLNVFEYNSRALNSYLRAGFKVEGRERETLQRDGKRWDLIFMGILRSDWELTHPEYCQKVEENLRCKK